MKNLQQIATFLLLAEMKNFNKVATKLNLSATAVSKQIKLLEQHLAKQLFLRTTRKVELTEFGESFLLHCRELADKIDDIETFIAAKNSIPQGKLKIVCSLTLGKALLLKHLAEFNRCYPLIDLIIEFSESTTGQQSEHCDIHFAYTEDPEVTDNMRYRKLFSISHILCAAPNYLKEHPSITTAADLMQHKFINLDLRKPIDEFKLANGKIIKTPKPSIIMNNFSALTEACLEGLGILLTADCFVEPHLASGKLMKILPKLAYRKFEVYLFYRAMKYELPKVKAFVDFYSEKITGWKV